MKQTTSILALSLLLAVGAMAQDQPATPPAPDAQGTTAAAPDMRSLMQNLRDDLTAAKANAKLTDKQAADLDQAIATLQTGRQQRKAGGQGNRQQMRASMMTIREIMQSDAFRPEDKDKIQADFKALRDARQSAGNRGARRRAKV